MQIQINSSEKIRQKIEKGLASSAVEIAEDALLEIVERGYECNPDKINIVFNPLDFDEVISFLKTKGESEQEGAETLTGLLNNKYSIIHIPDIHYIEAQSAQVFCYTSSGTYTLKKTLGFYEDEFKNEGIVRINKSQLVNMKRVKEIVPWFNSRLVFTMEQGVELEVSKIYAKQIRKMLNI